MPDSRTLTGEAPEQGTTLSVLPTLMGEVTPQAQTSPTIWMIGTAQPTDTDIPAQTITPVIFRPTGTFTSESLVTSSPLEIKCDAAQAGLPIDISVPDDTPFQPGERFTKTWRVVNSGSCTWNADYAVVWFSGDDLGLIWTQPLGLSVEPGQTVDLSVDMAAPETPGVYQSNWKLSNSQGSLFGIGPNSDAPIWVRIVVNPAYTPTPDPAVIDATAMPPPVILAQGVRTLVLDEGIDLNMWPRDPAVIEDLALQTMPAENLTRLVLAPQNGAGLVYYGPERPNFAECLQALAVEDALVLENYPPGAYYCYRTADQMPGRMLVTNFDTHNAQLILEYITWVVP